MVIKLKKGDKKGGTLKLTFDDANYAGIQYLEISTNLSASFVFRKLALPGKNYPESIPLGDIIWQNENCKIAISDAVESDNQISIEYCLVSVDNPFSLSINSKDILCIDDNGIYYSPSVFSFGGSSYGETTYSIPSEAFANGCIKMDSLDEFSYCINSILVNFSIDGIAKSLIIDSPIEFEGRDKPTQNPVSKGTINGLSFLAIEAKERDGHVIVPFLLKNSGTATLEIETYSSAEDLYVYDDRGNQHLFTYEFSGDPYRFSLEVGQAIKGECVIERLSLDAYKISYLNLPLHKIGGDTSYPAFHIRDILIHGRSEKGQQEAYGSGTIVSSLNNTSITILGCQELSTGSIQFRFSIFNENGVDTEKDVIIFRSSSFAYDNIDLSATREVSHLTLGCFSDRNDLVSTTIPGQIRCNAEVLISGVPSTASSLSEVLLHTNHGDIVIKDVDITHLSTSE